MKGLFPATLIYTLSYGLTRFVGFLLLPLYTNILSPSEFGTYTLLMAIYAILNVLYQAGLLQGLTSFFFNGKYPQGKVITTTLILLITICVTLALLLTIFARPVSILLLSDNNLTGLFTLVVWILFIDNISFLGLHLLKTEQKPKFVAIYSAVAAVVNISLNLLFLLQLQLGVKGIFIAQAGSGFVLLLLCLPALLKYFHCSAEDNRVVMFDKELAVKIFRFSLPFVIAGIFGILMDVADRFLIAIFLDRESLGLYGFAYKIGSVMSLFIIAFRTAFLPHTLNNKDHSQFPAILKRSFTGLLASMSVIFLTIFFFSEDISSIRIAGKAIINPEYMDSFMVIPFILTAYMFNGLAGFFSLAPYISGKSHHFIISDAGGLTVNIVLNLLLIPVYGIYGAAIATMAGFFAAAGYLYVIFSRSIKVPFSFMKIFILIFGGCLFAATAYFTGIAVVKMIVLLLFSLFCLTIKQLTFSTRLPTDKV